MVKKRGSHGAAESVLPPRRRGLLPLLSPQKIPKN
jgi:hypothetical protein